MTQLTEEHVAVLALLVTPKSRHSVAEITGCSYDTAAQRIAKLQADGLVTPCGHERTPGKRTYRTLFRTVDTSK
jgi:chromosome segregation and condensation protein ScpB